MTFDAIVVGGGVSGLTAALILARQGRNVAIIEKSPRLAPLIRGFSRAGSYFDSGFHYAGGLGEGEVLDLYFRYLGLNSRLEKYPFRADGFDLFRDAETGREFRFPTGLESLRGALCDAFPGEEKAIRNYLATLEDVCRTLPYLDPETPSEQWTTAVVALGPSLAQVLDRLTDNPALKRLLSLHCFLHGAAPDEIPFAIHASVTTLYYRTVHGIVGGGQSLARAFEAQLLEAGVTPLLGRAVKSLSLSAAGSLQGVELIDGEKLACRTCLVSSHPAAFLDMVPDSALRPAFRKRLQNLEETMSAYIVYAVQENPSSLLSGSNLILGKLNSVGSFGSGEIADRTLFMAANACSAPDAQASGWVAICPTRWAEASASSGARGMPRDAGYQLLKERITAALLERIKQEAPEVAEGARVLATATPLTLRDFTGSPTGGIYGVKHRVGQYNPQPVIRIPGVYLTGQATAAPGVLGAMLSAFLTCGHLVGHDYLQNEVLACR